MKKSKLALFQSIMALLLCVAMLSGTTFALFTDSETSSNNIITSGNLDVALHWSDDYSLEEVDGVETDNTQWKDAAEGAIFNYEYWEPGYTDIKYVKVSNEGNLALTYRLQIVPAMMADADVGELADVIDVYMVPAAQATGLNREAIAQLTPVGTLAELMFDPDGAAYGVLLPAADKAAKNVTLSEEDKDIAVEGEAAYCIMLKMQESAGNEYQDKFAGGGFTVLLMATQYTWENDSFGNDYDTEAKLPEIQLPVRYTVSVKPDENGQVPEDVTIGEGMPINAVVPQGVQLEEGTTKLVLTVDTLENSEANINVKKGETKTALDVHIDGIAEDNTVPMQVVLEKMLPTGLNSTSVELYHVEDGQTLQMTQVATPANHNEFSYDPATGTVVLCVASFSEFDVVTDNNNPWEGTANTEWYNSTDTEFTLTTAEQLAGFGVLVDGGNNFEGKTVKLGADINLGGGKSFNPIGCGYVNGTTNSKDVTGRAFMGTFDGQNHTISGLHQNGWDLGLQYCTLGGGLFASVADATIKNLTIRGADIAMECVEMGVLVGLSQGNCTYENINIYNSKIANYQRATGGLIGEVSAMDGGETTTIKNVIIGSDVVVGTLWGDFDAPVGGVIGARWDDGNTTKVNMENVTVAARLDVYNDITSTYQWHAYRRAGMLIGNTDTPPADGKNAQIATADFLTCSNVVVRYGDWVNYHYCEFSNHNADWPWVRVEEGENCAAYSNPRYGVPNDSNGNKVVDKNHVHQAGDTCMESIPFNQLYGGGQGVYGAEGHNGVTVNKYYYSVTYMDRGNVFAVDHVDNENTYTVKHTEYTPTRTESPFKAWVNAGGTKVDTIQAGNITDYVLYDSWHSVYTARFLDQQGNVIYEEEFNTNQSELTNVPAVPAVDGGFTGVWEEYNLKNATGDLAIKPVYNAEDGIIKLTPVDTEPQDGITDYYAVTNVNESDANINIVIPSSLNGIPVQEISGGAFAEFDNITTVRIPTSIKSLGADAFANEEKKQWYEGGTLKYEQITFLYEGTYAQWQAIEKDGNWDRYVGQGSRIYFLADGTYSEETARNGTWSATGRVWSEPKEGTYSGN